MAVPAPAHPFFLLLADGRACGAVGFPDGFVCVYHPDEPNICTIATSIDALLADTKPGHPLHGATAEEYASRRR